MRKKVVENYQKGSFLVVLPGGASRAIDPHNSELNSWQPSCNNPAQKGTFFDRSKAVTLTREDLHRRVWASPMKEVADVLHIAPAELRKFCSDLEVPCPHPKLWMRKKAGEKVVPLQLTKKSEATPSSVTITPTEGLVFEVTEGLAASKGKREGRHQVVAGWLAKRRQRDGCPSIGDSKSLWTTTELRGLRILEEIFLRLEASGLMVQPGDRILAFSCTYQSEEIRCRLWERRKRVRTSKGWTELKPTGYFTFTIDDFLGVQSPICREWRETQRKQLYAFIPDIVLALKQAGPALVTVHRQADERARVRLEAERLRKQEDERWRKDQNQWQAFQALAEGLEQSCRLRSFLEMLQSNVGDASVPVGSRTLTEWLDWASEHLEMQNPLNAGVAGVFEKIVAVGERQYSPQMAEQMVAEIAQRLREAMLQCGKFDVRGRVRIPFDPPEPDA